MQTQFVYFFWPTFDFRVGVSDKEMSYFDEVRLLLAISC